MGEGAGRYSTGSGFESQPGCVVFVLAAVFVPTQPVFTGAVGSGELVGRL